MERERSKSQAKRLSIQRGTLNEGEPHPAAESALKYVKSLGLEKLSLWMECFSSCAIEGNRLAEVCSETLHRVLSGAPVSDRYLLGLAWELKTMEDKDEANKKR